MTSFRIPARWTTDRKPGERPDLTGTWLDPRNAPLRGDYSTRAVSYRYWIKIHWATPPWTTDEMIDQMRDIYARAIPGQHEVDHIVPLSNPLVCGLHVPWNLQVMRRYDNAAKSNHHWPDCPDHLCPIKNATLPLFEDHPQNELNL